MTTTILYAIEIDQNGILKGEPYQIAYSCTEMGEIFDPTERSELDAGETVTKETRIGMRSSALHKYVSASALARQVLMRR